MKIFIVTRGSLSSTKFVLSRSVFCRILEPISYITEELDKSWTYTTGSTSEITVDKIIGNDVFIFCKHNTKEDVKVAQEILAAGKKVYYDIDDLIYRFTNDSVAYQHMDKIDNIFWMLQNSTHIITSNEDLDKKIKEDCSIIRTTIIKTGFNIQKWGKRNLEPHSTRAIFTNGDNIKLSKSYDQFVVAFNSFFTTNKDHDLVVFGDLEDYLKPLCRYTFMGSLPWDEHKLHLQNNNYNFAIIPLGGDEESFEHQAFSICKTPIKFMEYGAARIPGIYSKSKIYLNTIEDRVTGLLVDNTAEAWLGALREISQNKDLRLKITNNAFDAVAANHGIKNAALKWMDILSL